MPHASGLRPRWVHALVFALAALVYFSVAGARAIQPSANPHFAYQAAAWLDGRLGLDGDPPGYCPSEARRAGKCRHHAHDDWALIWTLEMDDGRRFRGHPCRRRDCFEGREPGTEAWLDLEGETHHLRRRSIVERRRSWFVSFPPGPAVFALPWVAAWGVGIWDVWLTALLASLAPVLIVWGLDRSRAQAAPHHLWIAAAWALASPALFVGAHGSVWFTAQTLGALFMLAYVFELEGPARPARSGLWLALAMSCRPHLALGAIVFAWRARREGRPGGAWLRFAAPLLVVGAALATSNLLRFGNPFEFGHRFLDIRWQARMQEHGQFSLIYLARNLECLLWLLPQARAEFPFFAVSLHGSALWVMSPWVVALGGAREALRARPERWVGALLIAAVPLLYHNSGQRQLSYRFALDWLPLLLPVLAASPWTRTRAFRLAVVFGAILSLAGAWYFDRDPARIFVTDPLGWPFEAELQR